MKRVLAGVLVASLSPAPAHAEPAAVLARAEEVDVLVVPGALRRLVYVARTGHPELNALVTALGAAAGVDASLTPFAARDAQLVLLQLTTTIADARATTKQTTAYLLRPAPDGGPRVVCALPAATVMTPRACGNGAHRDVVIGLEPSSDGVVRFTLTSQAYADFTAPGDGACLSASPIAYQPTVARYELAPDGTCTLVP